MELAKINNTTVLLDGQGADEVLAGYHSFFNIFLKRRIILTNQNGKYNIIATKTYTPKTPLTNFAHRLR